MATDGGAIGVGIARPPGAARGSAPLVVRRRVGGRGGRRSWRSRAASTASPATTSASPAPVAGSARPPASRTSRRQAGDSALVVFETPDGITEPVGRARDQRERGRARQDPARHVGDRSRTVRSAARSSRRTATSPSSPCSSTPRPRTCPKDVFDQIEAATAPATKAGVKVAYGGAVVDYADQPPSGNADLIGLLAAVVILLFAFGSVVAMGLPILTALFGLGVGHLARATSSRRSPRSERSRRRSRR